MKTGEMLVSLSNRLQKQHALGDPILVRRTILLGTASKPMT